MLTKSRRKGRWVMLSEGEWLSKGQVFDLLDTMHRWARRIARKTRSERIRRAMAMIGLCLGTVIRSHEYLRAALQTRHEELRVSYQTCREVCIELRKENERLRKALEEIAEGGCHPVWIINRAEKALHPEGTQGEKGSDDGS